MSNEPSDFNNSLDQNGIADPQGFMSFMNDFNADQGVFYSLSDDERAAMDGKMEPVGQQR